MTFSLPPELITGLTDLLNTVFSLAFWLWLFRFPREKTKTWQFLMAVLTASNLIGGTVHTLDLPQKADNAVWVFLYPLMCLTVYLFAECASEEFGLISKTAKWIRGGIVIGAILLLEVLFFISISQNFEHGDYAIYTYAGYAAACLIYALILFTVSAIRDKRYYLLWHVAGLAIQIPGGVVQAKRTLHFSLFGIPMDYNTFYHALLAVTLLFLVFGCRKEWKKG
ncbi:MAG: hypothetical protein KBS76_01660 [Ruminococcus sp.]|nr:hypothetical protein [Candidatus Apopatosoma intestinale]